MNFTDSSFEQMMKEAPRPGRGSISPCAGCRYAKECKNQKGRCRKKFRALLVGAAGFRPTWPEVLMAGADP